MNFDAKTKQLVESERAYTDAIESGRLMVDQIEDLRNEMSQVQYEKNRIGMLNETLEKRIEILTGEVADRENNIKYLNGEIQMMIKQHADELESALEGLSYTLEQKRLADIEALKSVMNAEAEQKLAAKNDQIEKMNSKIKQLIRDHSEEIEKFQDEIDKQRNAFEERIEGIEKSRNHFEREFKIASDTIVDRNEEVQRLMLQISECYKTQKSLEQDKADIYQKMIASDRLIRQEMTDKYTIEKNDLILGHNAEIKRAIEEFENSLRSEHTMAISRAVEDIKLKHSFELQKLSQDNERKFEGFLIEMNEKNSMILELESTIKSAQEEIHNLNERHKEDISKLHEVKARELDELGSYWENQCQSREKQIKVQSTLALSNLEKKHAQTLAQIEDENRTRVKLLEEEKLKALEALQKESDMIKSLEISRIHLAHKEEQEEIRNTLKLDLQAKLQKQQDDNDAAISELVTDYETQIKEGKEKITELESHALIHIESEKNLMKDIRKLEENEKKLTYEVESLTYAFKTQRSDFENKTLDIQKKHGTF